MEVYLDNSATTRCYTEVGELVYKVMCQDYGNPSSMHRKGVDAEHYIKDAKEILAKILKSSDHIIYRASGDFEYDALSGRGRRLSCDLSSGGQHGTHQAGSSERGVV